MNISNKNNKTNHSSINTWLLLLLSVFISIMVFICPGCSIPGLPVNQAETESQETAAEQQDSDITGVADPGSQDTAEDTASEMETAEESIDSEEVSGEITINVYYSDATAEYLVGETRLIPEENKYVEAIFEMMKEPTDSDLIRLIPETTKINSIVVDDGLAKVDFSSNFVEDRFQSDVVDILLVFSVVNTLTEFEEINSVEFYIDGERLELIGMLDLADPQFRRTDLIK